MPLVSAVALCYSAFMNRKNVVSILLVLLLCFGAGFGFSQLLLGGAEQRLPPEFDTLWQVWQYLQQDYVNKDALDPRVLTQGAIEGLIEALDDPYTYYLDAETKQLALSDLEGSFEGIGAVVSMEEEGLTIISPIAGSPAERQGLRAGDRILEIDGEPTSGMTLTEAVLKIRGPEGTTLTLLLLHQGEAEPVAVEITRDRIDLESVLLEMLPHDIAHIQITYFSLRTGEEFTAALSDALQSELKGIVLDLRGNPGGTLNTVVDVAGQLLDGGIVLYQLDSEGERSEWRASSGGLATDLPLAVLVDGGSASGSEVLAGALRDRGRAPLIGTTTYGKGSVQIVRELSDGSALRVTSTRWLTPDGHLIEGVGLTPDIEVEGADAQLERAIDYILELSPTAVIQ